MSGKKNCLTFAFQRRRRPEGRPQRLGAPVAGGGHVEGDLDELVALDDDAGALPVLGGKRLVHGGSGVVVGLAGLALAGVEDLNRLR